MFRQILTEKETMSLTKGRLVILTKAIKCDNILSLLCYISAFEKFTHFKQISLRKTSYIYYTLLFVNSTQFRVTLLKACFTDKFIS